jgi:DNA adenine methylase
VPIGTKNWVLREGERFTTHSKALGTARLMRGDFQKCIELAKKGGFILADPPYTTRHNNNGFIKYNERVFTWADQERLARSLRLAAKRGVRFAVLNSAHASIRELYKGYEQIELCRRQIISGDASGRASYTELLIRNY